MHLFNAPLSFPISQDVCDPVQVDPVRLLRAGAGDHDPDDVCQVAQDVNINRGF